MNVAKVIDRVVEHNDSFGGIKMKRLLILCPALVIAFSITGCQRNNDRLSIEGVREQCNPGWMGATEYYGNGTK